MLTQLHRPGPVPRPLLTRLDLPAELPPYLQDASSVFNPGAIRIQGVTRLLLRVQGRGRQTALLSAVEREDGLFLISPRPVELRGRMPGVVYHVYDPRITRIGERTLVVLALDTDAGGRLAIAEWDLAHTLDQLALTGNEDTRNGVLFPERIHGEYWMLDRPNRPQAAGDPASGETIRALRSPDLLHWHEAGPVMQGRWHYWDERIGAGPPPLRVREGWLLLYHGVATHFGASGIYQAGVALLDGEDPTRVIARCTGNILEPREPWEQVGQVPNVVFPSGWTADRQTPEGVAPPEARVTVYYGAADTCVGTASATVAELVQACHA